MNGPSVTPVIERSDAETNQRQREIQGAGDQIAPPQNEAPEPSGYAELDIIWRTDDSGLWHQTRPL